LWEERRFDCFEKLCQWDDLAETVLVDIEGELNKLWDDELQVQISTQIITFILRMLYLLFS